MYLHVYYSMYYNNTYVSRPQWQCELSRVGSLLDYDSMIHSSSLTIMMVTTAGLIHYYCGEQNGRIPDDRRRSSRQHDRLVIEAESGTPWLAANIVH
jgi:hypothetical protein